jgi:hypothetical protein
MKDNISIDQLSIADLKAALDFVREDIKDMEKDANEKNMHPEEIASYPPLKSVENALFQKLLNTTRGLYND